MIERGDFDWEISCDNCPEQEQLVDRDLTFNAALNEAKSLGWTVTKDRDGDWIHHCPTCSEEECE